MPYPSLTFANLLDNATRQELEQFVSLLQGYLSQEHDEEGAHGDVTATSLTVSGDVTGEGDGSFDGTVTADADGTPIVLAADAATGPGVQITNGTTSDWRLVASTASRTFSIRDVLEVTDVAMLDIVRTGLSAYDVRPHSSAITLTLGTNTSGQRWSEVNANTIRANTSYFERGRSAAQGDWATYVVPITFGGSGISVGNGLAYGSFSQVGNTTFYRVILIIGSTTAFPVSGAISFTLPTTASAGGLQGHFGPAVISDSSTGTVYPNNLALLVTSTTATLYQPNGALVTDTSPITLATGDTITITGFYENT
jgi:hypothetical protein